jgi:hypothetical protein
MRAGWEWAISAPGSIFDPTRMPLAALAPCDLP